MGKITEDNIVNLKDKILLILKDGGEAREANEWFFFYDKQNRYQGYCLKSQWEQVNQEEV